MKTFRSVFLRLPGDFVDFLQEDGVHDGGCQFDPEKREAFEREKRKRVNSFNEWASDSSGWLNRGSEEDETEVYF